MQTLTLQVVSPVEIFNLTQPMEVRALNLSYVAMCEATNEWLQYKMGLAFQKALHDCNTSGIRVLLNKQNFFQKIM